MKKYSQVPVIPDIDPERVVTYIVDNRKQDRVKLPQPIPAKNLKCPNCGSDQGFLNLIWDAWACKEDDCLIKWLSPDCALRKGYVSDKHRQKSQKYAQNGLSRV